MDKIAELQKEIEKEKKKLRNEFLKRVETKYGLKIGDTVEFIRKEREGDYGYTYDWEKRVINDFDSYDDERVIWVGLRGLHDNVKIEEVKLYDENDYTVRNSHWGRDMDLDDRFQLIVDKPNSTKGKIYSVEEVHKRKGCDIQYVYFNDDGLPQSLYEKEFHLTHK